jgi:2-C-methyl-D-erythritol 2,4-cyclodiphosphate synthase
VKITTADDLESARQRLASANSAAALSADSASSAAPSSVSSANSVAPLSADSASSAATSSATSANSAAAFPASSAARVGTGYDLHVLTAGRPLIVGGVTIPFDKGPLGHSDGDVACHAATDAILGAASMGDIGRHFPDTDPRWKGADSLVLLREAARIVADAGYRIVNLDITVILERPKIKDFIDDMRTRLAATVGIDRGAVSIKGKTNEGVDAVGRGEAIAAHAVALIGPRPSDVGPRTSDVGPRGAL